MTTKTTKKKKNYTRKKLLFSHFLSIYLSFVVSGRKKLLVVSTKFVSTRVIIEL